MAGARGPSFGTGIPEGPLTPALRAACDAFAAGLVEDGVAELSLRLLELPDLAEQRALPLHVLAFVEKGRDAPRDALSGLLAEAMTVERAAGLESLALHSSHQLALLTQAGATVGKVGAYYKETHATLTAMRNRQGAAFCLKSMAEIYLAHGRTDGALTLLQQASQLLVASGDASSARHVQSWLAELS